MAEESYLHMGIQVGFVNRSVHVEGIIPGTQLDIDRGVVRGDGLSRMEDDSQRSHEDINLGLYYYNKKFWLGAAAHHLTQPYISYMEVDFNRFSIRYALQGGIKFKLPGGSIYDQINNLIRERTLSFAFNYKRQGIFDQLGLGAEFYFEPLVLGLWYRGLPTKNAPAKNMTGLFLDLNIDVYHIFFLLIISSFGIFYSIFL